MANKGLIFIPDISGFTRFVSGVEIEHSRHIIEELLEVIINANEIGLEISEIEGDAILFYKYGEEPDLATLYRQVEKMFVAFHRHLVRYDHQRFCHCSACKGAVDLTLKVITHYGEFTGYTVKNFNKLIGKDIIVAHQLLKNDINQSEYWLVTQGLNPGKLPETLPHWLDWGNSVKQTETGEIPFSYTQLSKLKNELPPEPRPDLEIKNKVKVISLTREYDADILNVLHGAFDFPTRHKWQVGLKNIEDVSDPALPRIGTTHRCILDRGSAKMVSSSYFFSPERIEYGETGDSKQHANHFTLEKIGENKTRLTFDFFLKKNPVKVGFFNLLAKKKYQKIFSKSLDNLGEFVKTIDVPRPSNM